MKRILGLFVVVLLGAGVLVWRHAYGEDPPVVIRRTDVVAITVTPIPEGPMLTLSRTGTSSPFPIELVEQAIPQPLPGPLHQGLRCSIGADIVFRLADKRTVTYGPCRVPLAIQRFQEVMSAAVEDYSSRSPSPQSVAAAMLHAARIGKFQHAPRGMTYSFPVDCRVDRPNAFHGRDVYLCAVFLSGKNAPDGHLWEWGALVSGSLHTHETDPALIPTITGPFDPPWSPGSNQ